jgi:hypothetical protein
MAAEQNMRFSHRHNRDGSYDSICVRCFRTVTNHRTEAELARDEFRHVCEDWYVDLLRPRDQANRQTQ